MLRSSYSSRLAAALIVVASLAAFAPPSFSSGSEKKCWVAQYVSKSVPLQTVYMSDRGFKSVALAGGSVVVSKAPKWVVYIYNTKGKVYYATTVETFSGDMTSRVYGAERRMLLKCKWKPAERAQYFHVNITHYQLANPAQPNQQKDSFTMKSDGQENHDVIEGDYWAAEGVALPFQCRELLSRIFRLPYIKGMPMKLHFVLGLRDGTRDRIVGLRTLSLKRVAESSGEFDVPAGYRAVATAGDALVDKDSQAAFKEFTQWTDPSTGVDSLKHK